MAGRTTTPKKTAKTTAPRKTAKAAPKAPPRPAAATATVTAKTLERLPLRAVAFLKAIGDIPEVRAQLMGCGYDDAVHQRGWTLLEDVMGRASLAPPPMPVDDAATQSTGEAAAEIEAWAVPKFAIADAALRNHHPDARAFVFAKGLKAAAGSKGVLAVQTFLQRLDSLGGPERHAHAAEDRAALNLLALRGITVAERKRVRGLLEVVQKGSGPVATPAANPAALAAKQALYAWHNEWSSIAESVVKRRDYLIRMGLSTRKPGKRATPTPTTVG